MRSTRSLTRFITLGAILVVVALPFQPAAADLAKASPSGEEVWRLNCAAETFDFTDGAGNWWMKDEAFDSLYRWGYHNGSVGSTSEEISGTDIDVVFQYHRWGGTEMSYRVEVPNGLYEVKLLFAETFWKRANKRVFDVALEGNVVLDNYDAYASVGRFAADTHTFYVTVQDGGVDITFPEIKKDKAMISGIEVMAVDVADDAVLDFIQRKMFWFFWNECNPNTGLIKWGESNFEPGYGNVSSIASVGMGLSAITIAAERGWISQQAARDRVMNTLNSFDTLLENVHGFWYHYVDINNGSRGDNCEVSTVDSALFMLGALQAGEYFRSTYPEVAAKAEDLYERMDWNWWLNRTRDGIDDPNNNQFINMGWKPENDGYSAVIPNTGPDGGFFITDWWNRYSETLFVDVLALGSPTHPLGDNIWKNMHRWKVNAFGMDFIQEPPLFTHQYHHLWLAFQGRYDGHADYWENTRRATLANRQTCIDDPLGRYEPNVWGLTGCGGPDGLYHAYGGEPGGGHDGTVSPSGPMCSLDTCPDESMDAVRYMFFQFKHCIWGRHGFSDSFNVKTNWVASVANGLNNGASLLAVENRRTGLVRNTAMQNPHLRAGLQRAFTPVTEIVQYDSELHRDNWQPVKVAIWNLSENYQDFEEGNGTPGDYFWDAWDSHPAFAVAPSPVHRGTRSLSTLGHTVGIHPQGSGTLDLSGVTHVGVWVYDTVGNYNVELRLRDTTGASQPVWSSMDAQKDQWTLITWPLSAFTDVDLASIENLEIYEWRTGQVYFDDVFFTTESDITVELKDGAGSVRSANTVDGVVYEDGTYDVWVYTPTDLVVGWSYYYYTFFYPNGAASPWEARYDDDTTADEPWIPVTW